MERMKLKSREFSPFLKLLVQKDLAADEETLVRDCKLRRQSSSAIRGERVCCPQNVSAPDCTLWWAVQDLNL
jgi:hypothetical protein